MNVPIYRKLEIAFWDIAIDVLSQSKAVRFLVKEFMHLKISRQLYLYTGMVLAAGFVGFLLGFSLPLVAQLFK